MAGWAQSHPAAHMAGDLALWVRVPAQGQEARVPVLCESFGVNGLLVVCFWCFVFFVQDMEVFSSDFELGEAGVLFRC